MKVVTTDSDAKLCFARQVYVVCAVHKDAGVQSGANITIFVH